MPPRPPATSQTPVDWATIRTRLEAATDREKALRDEAQILQRRAVIAARPIATPTLVADRLHLVAFELANQPFGIEAAHVRESVSQREITPLPGLPLHVAGLVNIRSRIVPAFDLRPLLQLPMPAPATAAHLLLLEAELTEFAIVVERVLGAREVPRSSVRRDVPALNQNLLQGLLDDGLALLDVPALCAGLSLSDQTPRSLPPLPTP